MSLDIGEALSEGFNRTIQKNGLMIAGLLFITGLLNTVLSQTMASDLVTRDTAAVAAQPLALPINPWLAGALWLPVAILSVAVGIVAIRTFVSDETERIPEEFYKRNMLMTGLNMIVGGIAFVIIVLTGLVFLIVPGIYLLVALYFWSVFVAVENQNFIDGFKNSWELTKDNRLYLFALGLIVVVISAVVGGLSGIPTLAGLDAVGEITGQIGGALASAFSTAVLAQAYKQLK